MAEFGSFEEFWAALNRLYTATVALQERQEALQERQEATDRQLSVLVDSVSTLARIAEGHERRLDRLEGQ
jgi:D-serine deaminase-like pyridoxal phosphate-dependent protein